MQKKKLFLGILTLTTILNIGLATAQSSFESTASTLANLSSSSDYGPVSAYKLNPVKFTQDAGVYLALGNMTPELEEFIDQVREQRPELKNQTDEEIILMLLQENNSSNKK